MNEIEVSFGKQVSRDDSEYIFRSWAPQNHVSQIPIAGAAGSYFWDYDGKRYLDFGSHLATTNLGHQHPKVVLAIQEQAAKLCRCAPMFALDVRNEAAKLITEVSASDDNRKVFFCNSGAEANEHAVRMARLHTGRHKVLASYYSYHGATGTAIVLTGHPRRWPSEVGVSGVVHFWSPHLYRSPFESTSPEQECERALKHLRNLIELEGANTIAGIILEPVVGIGGTLVPPPGYLAGVRALCDLHGIVLIFDEILTGFGRTGQWFASRHWGVSPDLTTFAKGVNSGYVPLSGVLVSQAVVESFANRPYPGGLTYSGHPLGCASAVAAINAMKEEGTVEHARSMGEDVLGPGLADLAARHASVGDVRGIGAMWAIELVRNKDTREPLVPFNAVGADDQPMVDVKSACRNNGLWVDGIMNRIHIVPPCNTPEIELIEGLQILDYALTIADEYAQ